MKKLLLILCIITSMQPIFCSDTYSSTTNQQLVGINFEKKILIAFSVGYSAALFYWNTFKKRDIEVFDLTQRLINACAYNNTILALYTLKLHANNYLKTKIDINKTDICGPPYTALMHACKHNNVIIARAILHNHKILGLDINNIAGYYTTFRIACEHSPTIALEILRLHDSLGLNVNNNPVYPSALINAYNHKNPSVILTLLDMHKKNIIHLDELSEAKNIKKFFCFVENANPTPEVREALFSIIMQPEILKDHDFSRLSHDALQNKNTLEQNISIDQHELMKINLYEAYETWIKEKDPQPLTDLFVYLPTRMLLNMKIIKTSEPYASDKDCFSRSMCTLYEKWFGRDEHSQTLHQALWDGEKISPESLQNIHVFVFNRMLRKQIELKQHDQEQGLCIGLQLTALSNMYFKSKEHLAAILGMLISLENEEQKKKILCRRLCMFTDALLDTFMEKEDLFQALAFSSSREKTFVLQNHRYQLISMYQSLKTGFFKGIISSPILTEQDLALAISCNHKEAVLNWIREANVDTMPKEEIECYSNLFRYSNHDSQCFIDAWNKKIFGEEFVHEFDPSFAKHVIAPIKKASAYDHALYLQTFLEDQSDHKYDPLGARYTSDDDYVLE